MNIVLQKNKNIHKKDQKKLASIEKKEKQWYNLKQLVSLLLTLIKGQRP